MSEIVPTIFSNIDNLTLADIVKYITNHSCATPQIAVSLFLFKSDMPIKSQIKSEEVIQSEFLWHGACYQMRIKDFLSALASLCEYI